MMSPDLDLEQQQLQNLHRSIHLSATGEYEDDCSAISFITALVSRKRHDRVKLNSPFTIMFLAIMSLAVVLSYNAVIGQLDFPVGRRQFNAPSSRQLEATRSHDQQIEDRIMAVTKEVWPKCLENHMTATECKEFIDNDIQNEFTGKDRDIRTVIKGKRNTSDAWYNTVVILMDDYDIVQGLSSDGQVEAPFVWEGSGEQATPEQESEIPPVIAVETEAGSPIVLADPTDPALDPAVAAAADPEAVEFEPLIFADEPVLVEGATVEGAISGTDDKPIAGGVVIDPGTPNADAEADATFDAAIQEAQQTLETEGVPEAGTRALPTFDCEGLSGYNCCLLIKSTVADSDVYGNAIQCHLNYAEGSIKAEYMKTNSRGKKVHIYANHNWYVTKVPKITGKWPTEKNLDEFLANV